MISEWKGYHELTIKKALKGEIFMVYTNSAKILEVQEMRDSMDEESHNPTVERMIFLETREKESVPGKVFPCFLEAYGYIPSKTEGEEKGKDELAFKICIMQCTGNEFAMVRVIVGESEIGVSKRFWDKAPSKDLREEHPFLDSEVKQ